MESSYLIMKDSQSAEFSVVIPEQSKSIKPVHYAFFSIIPDDDPDLTTYLHEVLKTNKPEQHNNTFLFPTPQNLGQTENDARLHTRFLRELCELQKREQIEIIQNNPGNKYSDAKISHPNSNVNNNNNNNKNSNRAEKSQKLFMHPVGHVARRNIPQKSSTMESMQPKDRLLGKEDRKDKVRSKKEPITVTRMKLLMLQHIVLN